VVTSRQALNDEYFSTHGVRLCRRAIADDEFGAVEKDTRGLGDGFLARAGLGRVFGRVRQFITDGEALMLSDTLIQAADRALRTLLAAPIASRAMPVVMPTFDADGEPDGLDAAERAHAGALMRVNHVGEVCAQALYAGQALATRNEALRAQFIKAGEEEGDHLAWTAQRLRALGARPSLLNPIWYAGSFGLGVLASRLGDQASLGFVVETERQVEAHLDSHLAGSSEGGLPEADQASRAVVASMKQDEVAHAQEALEAGAGELPTPVKLLMQGMARVMTRTAYYV
jgi:3-demethoxyubiquinol 3-hydroxylase